MTITSASRLASIAALILVTGASGFAQTANCGDCNVDGRSPLDITDALTAAQIAVGLFGPTPLQMCACDTNGDAAISVLDVIPIAQIAVGLSPALSCSSPVCGMTVNTPPTVVINQPTGGTVSGPVVIDFDTADIDGDMLDVTIEFSTNGGALFALASDAGGGSLPGNPSGFLPAAAGQTFAWDSIADGTGLTSPQVIVLQVTAFDGLASTSAIVAVTVDNTSFCFSVACGATVPSSAGMGSGGPPTLFDFSTHSVAFEVTAGGRTPGDAVEVRILNLSDDFDLYIANPGTACGDVDPANYRPAAASLFAGMTSEFEILGDSDLLARGNNIAFVAHHFDPNPTGTFDIQVTCIPVAPCAGTLTCGGMPIPGTTGSAGGVTLPASFTEGLTGDSAFFEVDTSGRPAGGAVEIRALAPTNQIALLVQWPGVPCGYRPTSSWTGIQGYIAGGTGDAVLLLGDDLLSFFPGGIVPLVVYNFNPGAPSAFNMQLTCPPMNPCTGVLTCGSMVSDATGPGTQAMITEFTYGPAGDSDGWTLDLSAKPPGEAVKITLESPSSDLQLFILAGGMPCAFPLRSSLTRYNSQRFGVGLDDVVVITDADIAALGTDQLSILVYHYDPDPTGPYNLRVECMPCFGCAGTVEGVLDESILGLPIMRAGDTTMADDTTEIVSIFTCAAAPDPGGPDHVYEFTPAADTTYTFSVCGASFDTLLGVREADCEFGVTRSCDDDSCIFMGVGVPSQIIGMPMQAGRCYYVVVDGWGGAIGTYNLVISSP